MRNPSRHGLQNLNMEGLPWAMGYGLMSPLLFWHVLATPKPLGQATEPRDVPDGVAEDAVCSLQTPKPSSGRPDSLSCRVTWIFDSAKAWSTRAGGAPEPGRGRAGPRRRDERPPQELTRLGSGRHRT